MTFDDHAEAVKFDALIRKVGADKALQITRIVMAPDQTMTVDDWLSRHNAHLTGVSAGTLHTYGAYLRNDIAPVLGPIPLAALTADDVARWLNGLNGSGKTIANKHGYLAGALNAAVKAGHLRANPCDGNRLPRWDREEMVFLTREEFRTLLDNVPCYWQPMVEFLAASGCRWSEAAALRPGDVDVKAGTVRISRAWKTGGKDGGYVLGVPKTRKSVRTINVHSSTLGKLDYSSDWLFTNSGRGRAGDEGPVRIHSFHPNVWTPAVKRARDAGLTKSPRIHDLRHTCASWLIHAGRPLPSIQQHLGHESITTTVSVYGHLDRSSGKGNADAIGNLADDE